MLGDDYNPPLQRYYFRQGALSEYNGTRLVEAKSSQALDRDVAKRMPFTKIRLGDQPPAHHRKTIRSKVALLVQHPQPFGLATVESFEPWNNPNPERFVGAYKVVSRAFNKPYLELKNKKAGKATWSAATRAHYLRTSVDPRFAELAKRLNKKLPEAKRKDPFLRALNIKLWMDESLTYSTRERHANAKDPTADFLFGNRIGYCVHFAHAAVFLWRSLGIPSRIGTGYATTADDRSGSTLLIMDNQAHAWPELYLEGAGWVVLDISAKRNLDAKQPAVDKELQRRLGDLARKERPDPSDPSDVNEEPIDLRPLLYVLLGLLAMATVALYLSKLWRHLAPRFAATTTLPRVGYRSALDRLAEVGQSRTFGETRQGFSDRIKGELPAFHTMTQWHIRAYWSDPSVPLEERSQCERAHWQRALKQLDDQIKAMTSRRRRWLGRLNPISFLRSR